MAVRQEDVTHRYDRLAWAYDLYTAPMEVGVGRRRARVLSQAKGRTLEVGVGTGRNFRHYGADVELVGIDVAPRMLERARRRAERREGGASLQLADVQSLPFPAASFDTVTATCVFCSVADPVLGLRECARVLRPGGRLLLVEHVRPRSRLGGWLADRLARLTRRMCGVSVNRPTEENVAAAGFEATSVTRHGVWREIVAEPHRQ